VAYFKVIYRHLPRIAATEENNGKPRSG